jgi:hypothetical protein
MQKPSLKRKLAIRCALVIGTLALLIGPFAISEVYNNQKFSKFCRSVRSVPLPARAELLYEKAEFGLLTNGNWCSHRVTLVVATDMSLEDVQRHYDRFPTFSPNEDEREEANRAIIWNLEDHSNPLSYVPKLKPGWHAYVVSFWAGTESGLDIRCS